MLRDRALPERVHAQRPALARGPEQPVDELDPMAGLMFEGGPLRCQIVDGAPVFAATDLAHRLGHRDAEAICRRLEPGSEVIFSLDWPGMRTRSSGLTLAGVWAVIAASRKPSARALRLFMSRVVMPRVVTRGGFATRQAVAAGVTIEQLASDEPVAVITTPCTAPARADLPAMLRLAAAQLEAANARTLDAHEVAATERLARVSAEQLAADLRPAALAWRRHSGIGGDHATSEAAKILCRENTIDIGRSGLFAWMLDRGMVYLATNARGERYYTPKQSEVRSGRLAVRIGSPWINPKTGEIEPGRPQVRITLAGILYIRDRMIAAQASTPAIVERERAAC